MPADQLTLTHNGKSVRGDELLQEANVKPGDRVCVEVNKSEKGYDGQSITLNNAQEDNVDLEAES